MNAVLFGATGMVGGGVLRECLEDDAVQSVMAVGRRASGLTHPKLRDRILPDLGALDAIRDDLARCDACFYCVGVSAAGMGEAAYRRVTYDLTMAAATLLAEVKPGAVFCYLSAQGANAQSRFMWARVKADTEDGLFALPLTAYAFRPGIIQPMKGVRSRTKIYQALYTLFGPVVPVLARRFPRHVTTTVNVGRAMIEAARSGSTKRVLETDDINALATGS